MVIYKVRLFAVLKERLGCAVWEWECSQPLLGSQLLASFFQSNPGVAGLQGVTRLAVNQAFCTEDALLAETDELALIPPVSGG